MKKEFLKKIDDSIIIRMGRPWLAPASGERHDNSYRNILTIVVLYFIYRQ